MIDQFHISEKLTGLIVFEIEGKEFCADIKDISAILNPRDLKIEVSNISTVGSIKLNEIDIPVISLNKYFGVHYGTTSKDTRVMLIEAEEKLYGFVVEKVKEIFTMNQDFRNKLNYTPIEKEYIVGKINYEKRELLLPDFKKIIDSIKN